MNDARHVKNGELIPSENYCDQPFVVKTDDGAWLLVMTTGMQKEGEQGQHIISMRSMDCGKSWIEQTDVERADNPESSYAALYKTRYGRVYCLYNYNADNVREIIADDPPFKGGKATRVDSLGHFVFKYSDDHGKTWSDKWYDIPIRPFDVDLNNPYQGKLLYFWNASKTFELDNSLYVPLYRVGNIGVGFFYNSVGSLLCCSNINEEKDPEKLVWTTLPEGRKGICTERSVSNVSEEQSFVPLSDGSIFCVFRTVSGHPYCCYSRDKGKSFTTPEVMRYHDGRPLKHPRAANFIWKCANGKYVYWHHNNGLKWYEGRNPVWLSGAVEYRADDGLRLKFSQPEIFFYDADVNVRMSYPDLIEEDGEYYITETQKQEARTHKIDKKLLEGLWNQLLGGNKTPEGILLSDSGAFPKIGKFTERNFNYNDYRSKNMYTSFALSFQMDSPESTLFSTLDSQGCGIKAEWNAKTGSIEFRMSDERRVALWASDPIDPAKPHSVCIIVDGGPKIISFVIDGVLCDGGDIRPYGYGWFDQYLLEANGAELIRIGDGVQNLRFYDRLVTVSEAILL